MPPLQSLVLTDRASTPVNHTLTPVGRKDGVATVALADASGVAITEKRFSISRRETADRVKTSEKFRVPTVVTETINGVARPTVVRVAYVTCTFDFEKGHTEQERKDVVGMFHSAHNAGKVLTEDTIIKNQDTW